MTTSEPRRGKASLLILTLDLLIVVSAGWFVHPGFSNPASYTLYGETQGWGYSPTTVTSPGPDLTALPGEDIVVTLYSSDDIVHNFAVDYNGNGSPDTGEPLSERFGGRYGQPIIYQFTITTTSGTYIYYCTYHAQQFGSIIVGGGNSPPVLSPIGPRSVVEEIQLAFEATAADPDPGQTLTFSLGTGSPAGASITTAGSFTWTPTETQGPGLFNVAIIVSDGALTDSELVEITVDEANKNPTLTVPGSQVVNEETQLTFPVAASDPDDPANTITISAANLLSGSTFPTTMGTGSANGTFSWTPAVGQAGSYNVIFNATDDGAPSLFDAGTVSITVLPLGGSASPTLDPIGTKTLDEETLLQFNAVATDPDPGQTLTFSLGPGAPSGATIDPTTGVFTWIPSEAQGYNVYTLTIIVTDNGSPPASDSETITVTVNEVNKAPILTLPLDQTVDEEELLTFNVITTDPDIPANQIVITASGLPAGSSFDNATGVFQWLPGETQAPGDFTVIFTGRDNGDPTLSKTGTVTIHVNEVNRPPILNVPFASQTVAVGDTFAFALSGTDSDIPADTVAFSALGLPEGALFDAVKQTFWFTPNLSQVGRTYNLTFTATDNGSPSLLTSETIRLSVASSGSEPVSAESAAPYFQYLSQALIAAVIVLIMYPLVRAVRQRRDRPAHTSTKATSSLVAGVLLFGGPSINAAQVLP